MRDFPSNICWRHHPLKHEYNIEKLKLRIYQKLHRKSVAPIVFENIKQTILYANVKLGNILIAESSSKNFQSQLQSTLKYTN